MSSEEKQKETNHHGQTKMCTIFEKLAKIVQVRYYSSIVAMAWRFLRTLSSVVIG